MSSNPTEGGTDNPTAGGGEGGTLANYVIRITAVADLAGIDAMSKKLDELSGKINSIKESYSKLGTTISKVTSEAPKAVPEKTIESIAKKTEVKVSKVDADIPEAVKAKAPKLDIETPKDVKIKAPKPEIELPKTAEAKAPKIMVDSPKVGKIKAKPEIEIPKTIKAGAPEIEVEPTKVPEVKIEKPKVEVPKTDKIKTSVQVEPEIEDISKDVLSAKIPTTKKIEQPIKVSTPVEVIPSDVTPIKTTEVYKLSKDGERLAKELGIGFEAGFPTEKIRNTVEKNLKNIGDVSAKYNIPPVDISKIVYFDKDVLTQTVIPVNSMTKEFEANVNRVYYGYAKRNEEVARASDRMNDSVRKVGSSFLWVGLGSMFLTMNIRQLIMEMSNLQKQSLSLLRSFASYDDTLENVRDTLIEFGAGSNEGRKALRDLALTQMELKYSVESLADSYKTQMLTAFMLIFSFMGQSLGTMSMLGSSFDRLHLTTAEYTRALNNLNNYEMQNAMILSYVDTMLHQNTDATATNALATKLRSIQNMQSAQSDLMLASSANLSFMAILKQRLGLLMGAGANQVFTASTLMAKLAVDALLGSLTFGISILASYAMSEIFASIQMDRMNEQLASMGAKLGINTNINSLSDDIYGLGNSALSAAGSLSTFNNEALNMNKVEASEFLKPITAPKIELEVTGINDINANVDKLSDSFDSLSDSVLNSTDALHDFNVAALNINKIEASKFLGTIPMPTIEPQMVNTDVVSTGINKLSDSYYKLADSVATASDSLVNYATVATHAGRIEPYYNLGTAPLPEYVPAPSKSGINVNVSTLEVNITTNKSIEEVPDRIGESIIESIKRSGMYV